MAAPPRGWQPERDGLSFQTVGDHVFYRFARNGDPAPAYWLIDRCGGEAERFTSATPGMTRFTELETDEGWVLYAQKDDRHFILDRLDVPGFDAPRPVPGLPAGKYGAGVSALGMYFSSLTDGQNNLAGAAGIGAPTRALYLHHGVADAPAVTLGVRIVQHQTIGDRIFTLDDDGDFRDVDPVTGASELVLGGVRRFNISDAARRLIWQQLGDDVSEPIFLRDLDTGEDWQIAVNDFTTLSWNRPGDPDSPATGAWAFTAKGDYAALYGPAHTLAAVVRTSDGAAIEPPPAPACAASSAAASPSPATTTTRPRGSAGTPRPASCRNGTAALRASRRCSCSPWATTSSITSTSTRAASPARSGAPTTAPARPRCWSRGSAPAPACSRTAATSRPSRRARTSPSTSSSSTPTPGATP
ncbi:hypothetical protein [Nannocystis pusilla]|uniref:hypothetical protein n=1 Tax=Nannocystis pusilla TaxID=889268 RepID=UPI003B78ED92